MSAAGNGLAKFSLAVDDRDKGKDVTLWLNCVVFGKAAELCRDHVAKGDMLLIEGRLSENRYTSKDGVEQRYMSTLVDKVTLLPRAKGEQAAPKAADPWAAPFDSTDDVPF
jgi:single-strand DNA-binding protein